MYTPRITELQDLVDKLVEREWSEFKSWPDLSVTLDRAGIARHLAALSNYGGGYLIFGFEDDGTRCAPLERAREHYGHDVLAGIIDKYLRPKFQCEVDFVTCAGVEHPVVWVPPHGTTPVIAQADGPQDKDGRVQGIRSGSVYIRSPKPESVPITTPDQWDKLIQRCVIARRDELVGMFSSMITGGARAPEKTSRDWAREKLAAWHKATQVAALAPFQGQPPFQSSLGFVQFSYLVVSKAGELLPAGDLANIVERSHNAVRDTVRSGWSLFYPFTQKDIAMHFGTDPVLEDPAPEFLEVNLSEKGSTRHGDLWRISADGRASTIRNFQEDGATTPPSVAEGAKWFDPWLHIRDVTEAVRHARALAEEFKDADEICFRLEWQGLKGRVVASSNGSRYWSSEDYGPCAAEGRIIAECFPLAAVIGNMPGVVSRLYAPVHRLFDPHFEVTPEWIGRLMPSFLR